MDVGTSIAQTERQLLEDMRYSFTNAPISTRSAVKAINNLIYMLSAKGISKDAAKDVYVVLLKGFQSKDHYLKLFIYCAIEALSKYTDEKLIGINILINDLGEKLPEEIKAKTLRALFSIVPEEMVYNFGKYVNQAAISTSPDRKDMAVLVTCKLLNEGFGQVRKWLEGIEFSGSSMADHHIAGFLAQARRLTPDDIENFHGPAGIICVRVLMQAARDDNRVLSIFKKILNPEYSDAMVFFEAAKALCNFTEERASQFVLQAVQSLRTLLRSTKNISRFGAIRILSQLAQKYPKKVSAANKDIEGLISSDNKTISMFAITTLLKTGTEETVDRLVKMLPNVMHEMSEELKKTVIETLESLSDDFCSKRFVYMDFLGDVLLQKGELEFKKYVVRAIGRLVKKEKVKDKALDVLCTYIEDSQHMQITLNILGIFGEEIPESRSPCKYIVHVLNRLILENNPVRAAALQCLYDVSVSLPSSMAKNAISQHLYDQDEMVSVMAKFLIRNFNIAGSFKPFDIEEFGSRKSFIMKHLGNQKDLAEDVSKEDCFIKQCRELTLTNSSADVEVRVTKKMYSDRVILSFSIENRLEEAQVCSGLLSFVCSGSGGKKFEKSIEIDEICSLGTLTVSEEFYLEEGSVFNGVFDYAICIEENVSDTEADSITLKPFQISIVDFVRPVDIVSIPSNKRSVLFALQGDVCAAGKKILDLLNMKIDNQDVSGSTMIMSLTGEYFGLSVCVRVNIFCDDVCRCETEVCCDDEDVCLKIAMLFD